MSLQLRIESLVTRIAQEFKTVQTRIGSLGSLRTNDKTNLVGAINELKSAISNAQGIDDAQASDSSTYSSNKLLALLNTLKSDIVGGADGAYDTLLELQTLLQNDTRGLDALLASVNKRVRYDASQTLSSTEQQQALTNLGAASASSVGDTATNFVTIFESALA